MSKDIRQSLLYFTSARDVWEELHTRYVRSDGPRVFHLEKLLSSISQGTLSITAYYNLFKGLWDEFFSCRSVIKCSCGLCTCNIPTQMAVIQQSNSAIKFLVGLHESYSQIHSQLLLLSPLPTLPKVYSLLLQEESQKNLNNSAHNTIVIESAVVMMARQGQRPRFPSRNTAHQSVQTQNHTQSKFQFKGKKRLICSNCGWPGHTIERCFQLIGYSSNWPGPKGPRDPPPPSANLVMSDVTENPPTEETQPQDNPLFTPQMFNQFIAYARNHQIAKSQAIDSVPSHSAAAVISTFHTHTVPSAHSGPSSYTAPSEIMSEFNNTEDDWFC